MTDGLTYGLGLGPPSPCRARRAPRGPSCTRPATLGAPPPIGAARVAEVCRRAAAPGARPSTGRPVSRRSRAAGATPRVRARQTPPSPARGPRRCSRRRSAAGSRGRTRRIPAPTSWAARTRQAATLGTRDPQCGTGNTGRPGGCTIARTRSGRRPCAAAAPRGAAGTGCPRTSGPGAWRRWRPASRPGAQWRDANTARSPRRLTAQ